MILNAVIDIIRGGFAYQTIMTKTQFGRFGIILGTFIFLIILWGENDEFLEKNIRQKI